MQNQKTALQDQIRDLSEPMETARSEWIAAKVITIHDDSEGAALDVIEAEEAVIRATVACVGDAFVKLSMLVKSPTVFVNEDDRIAASAALDVIETAISRGDVDRALHKDTTA